MIIPATKQAKTTAEIKMILNFASVHFETKLILKRSIKELALYLTIV